MEGIAEAGTGGGRGTGSYIRWRQRVAIPVQFRLAAKVDVRGPDECWLWQGRINEDGYGLMKAHGYYRYVHRLMYGQVHGGIPAGHDIHHTCRNRACANPQHLVALTRSEHARQPGHVGEPGTGSTFCSKGHQYRHMASGGKYCPECRNAWERKTRAENKPIFSVRIVRQPGQSWDDVLRELRRVEGELRREYGG